MGTETKAAAAKRRRVERAKVRRNKAVRLMSGSLQAPAVGIFRRGMEQVTDGGGSDDDADGAGAV